MSTLVQDSPGAPDAEAVICPDERTAAAARLGAERRRLFFVGAVISIGGPFLLYLTGAWENAWFALAAAPLGFWPRTVVFLLGAHLLMSVMLLPLTYYSGYVVAHAFGLSRQTSRAWALDWLKGTLLTMVFGSLFGVAFLWTVTTLGGAWWVAFGALATALGLALVFITPYVLVPLFFKMRPLADAPTVERIHALVARAGAPVREVCSLDFSRRTAEANAAVIGIGRSRRVVLADTLLQEFTPGEVDAVVAHEIGHHVHRDIHWLLLVNGAVMWLGLALGAWLAPAVMPVLSVPSLDYVPAYPVLFAVAELYFLVLAPLTNWWSRRLESNADSFALGLTRNPGAFSSAMQRLGCQNLIENQPPRWAEVLLATHPALHRRIERARAWSAS